jgi:uncharacterized protein YoxC
MLVQESIPAVAGWVGPTIAISLVVIALAFAAIAGAFLMAGKGLTDALERVIMSIDRLQGDLVPAIKSLGLMAEDGRELAQAVKREVGGITATSQRLRERIEIGSERLAERLENLEAVYDVVEEEVTEAALDLTATIRTIRSGAGWFGRIRRLLRGGSRHRRRRR